MADDPAEACFALLERACDAYGRADLTERLRHARERWERPHLRLLVVGSFKQGKSTLVNALLGKEVCPTDDHVATALPLIIRHGPKDRATEIIRDDEGELHVREIAVDAVAAIAVGADDRDEESRPVAIERITPSRLLERGLEIVDTPGTGGLDSRHATATRATFPTADAVLFVTDATQELTGPELGVLAEAVQQAGAAALVVTKADMSPAWRRLVDLDRGHLDVAGIEVPVFPVSSAVRRAALSTKSKEVNVESGFAEVARWLSALAADGDALADAVALREAEALIDRLLEPHVAARDAASDPDAAARLVEELEEAEARAEQLRSTGRWQQVLSDGISDLTAEVDHDFRERMRTVTRDAEAMLDEADPADCWDDFEPWVYVRVSDEVVANTALLNEQATLLATRLEEHFGEEGGGDTASLALSAPVETLGSLEGVSQAEPRKVGRTQTGLTAVRGMQGGVMMFGMLGNLVGLTIAGPAVIGVGLVMGAKTLRDERKRQVTVRRQQAKQATRRYLDEVQFQVGKDNRAAMRRTQRLLRDHFTNRAAEAQRSVAEALQAAKQALANDEQQRSRQLADATAEIERLDALRRQCRAGLGPEARAGSEPLDEVAV